MLILSWKIEPILALTKEENLLIAVGALTGTLLFGALIISRVDRWRKRQMSDDETPATELGSFRSMYERGELSKEEYERILQRIATRAGVKPKVVTPPEPPSTDPAPDQPPSPPTT
jgi:hypothetical protein